MNGPWEPDQFTDALLVAVDNEYAPSWQSRTLAEAGYMNEGEGLEVRTDRGTFIVTIARVEP